MEERPSFGVNLWSLLGTPMRVVLLGVLAVLVWVVYVIESNAVLPLSGVLAGVVVALAAWNLLSAVRTGWIRPLHPSGFFSYERGTPKYERMFIFHLLALLLAASLLFILMLNVYFPWLF